MFIFTNFSFCHQFYTKNYSVEDGLSHSSVIRIYQDKKGFIWFCTNYGLSRFDGRTFKNYTTSEGLTHNFIMAVTESDDGKMYISTYGGGVDVLYGNKVQKLYLSAGQLPKIIMRTVPDKKDLWVIGYESGGRLYRIKDNIAKPLYVNNEAGKNVIFFDFLRTKNEIIFATNSGLYKAVGDTVIPYLHNITRQPVLDVQAGKNNDYWMGLLDRVVHIKDNQIANEFVFTSKTKPANNIDMLIDHTGKTWINAMGIGTYMILNNKLTNITQETKVNNTCLTDMFEDKQNNIWFSTWGQGVFKMSSQSLVYYGVEAEKMNVYCRTLTPLNNKKVIVGSMNTVGRWENDSICNVNIDLLKKAYCSYYVYFVYPDSQRLLVGTTYGIIEKNKKAPYKEQLIPATIVGSSRVDLQACKLEYSIVSPK